MRSASKSANLVSAYLKNIGRFPLLSHEQEITLGKTIQRFMELEEIRINLTESLNREPTVAEWAEQAQLSTEDLEKIVASGKHARTKMVRSNLRLVVSIAKKYKASQLEMMDLIQEGNIGLHRGVEKFDPTKGYRFSTYAYWWIRQAITRAMAETSRTIRLPIHVHEKLSKLRKVQRQLSQSLGRPAKIGEVADALSLSVEKVRQLQKQRNMTLSLNMRVGSDQGSELGALIESDAPSPEAQVTQRLLKSDLKRLMLSLTERQRAIVSMRYGLESGKRMTLAQISDRVGLSRERIRQIERKSLRLLRNQGRGMRGYVAAS